MNTIETVRTPYIGVTGFTHADEVKAALEASGDELLMVGVLASSTTLEGDTNNWKHRYPRPQAIAGIFPPISSRTLNLLHFSTSRASKLDEWLEEASDIAGPNCQGFQLNMLFPDPDVLKAWKEKRESGGKDAVLVVQCGARALESARHQADVLAAMLDPYDGIADYVLIDPSGGLGVEFNPVPVIRCFKQLRERGVSFGLGAAGGLSAESVGRLLPPIIEAVPSFSIDAEGRLRDEGDVLDIEKMTAYIKAARGLFAES